MKDLDLIDVTGRNLKVCFPMVVIRSFKQFYKQDTLSELAPCSLSADPKVNECYYKPPPPTPQKSTRTRTGACLIPETNHLGIERTLSLQTALHAAQPRG